LAASGGVGPTLAALAGGFTTAFNRLVATPVPTSTDLPPTDSPRIAPPDQPYTRTATIDLNVSVPSAILGDPKARVRIYLALQGLEAAPIVDVPVGTTSRIVVPFQHVDDRGGFEIGRAHV